MAMTAQEYLDTFNAAINSGAYEDAARILRQAEGDFGPGVYDVAGVVLEANPNLPQEVNYMSPQGIQSIKDYVASVPSPVTAVSPALNFINTLPDTGLIPSGNVSGTGAGVVSSGPPVGSLENPAVQSPIKLGPVPATRVMTRPEQEKAFTQIYTQTQVDDFVDSVLRGASTGDFSEAASILSRNAADPRFGEDVYGVAADLLNTDPRFAGLREQVGGAAYTPENLRSFVTNQLAVQEATPAATPTATPEATPAATPAAGGIASIPIAPQTTPGPGQLYGMPTYTRQEYSPLRFAPLRRASGFTPEQLQSAVGGRSVEDIAYLMDTGRVSPAELSSALNLPVGQIQAQYNQVRPGGLFSTPGQDFVLQTGAYGAPTPTFFTPNYPTPAPETPAKATAAVAPVDDTQYMAREGGMIKMAEGGEAMAKLSPAEAGSKFDISEFIDEQGRLVGGYSRPIRDEFGVITSYDYQPYQRDVVFNPRLAEAEAEARRTMTDEDRAVMMRDLAIRQGRTGVNPYSGAGLPGIVTAAAYDRPRYYNYQFAKGGDVSSTAQDLASRGRGGDTMLVHMAPHEVAGLNALARSQGTELTINPETGMPEALKLGKLFKQIAPFIPFIPGVGAFLAPMYASLGLGGLSGLAQGAITSGIIGGFTGPKKGFDFQRGLTQGIMSYGIGSVMQNAGMTPGTSSGPATVAPDMGGVNVTGDVTGVPGEIPSPSELGQFQGVGGEPGVSTNIHGTYSDTAGGIQTQPRVSIVPETTAPGSIGEPMSTEKALLTTALAGSSQAQADKATVAQMNLEDEEDRQRRLYRDVFERTLGRVPTRTMTGRAGGLMKLAGGGMTYMEAGGTTGPTGAPRDVVGTGDGMSDSVPADIEGVQEARLADGEFVIPADVVSDIGNGSSSAGSDKLYAMMDRVRMARHGTKEQPPEINAERMMPA